MDSSKSPRAVTIHTLPNGIARVTRGRREPTFRLSSPARHNKVVAAQGISTRPETRSTARRLRETSTRTKPIRTAAVGRKKNDYGRCRGRDQGARGQGRSLIGVLHKSRKISEEIRYRRCPRRTGQGDDGGSAGLSRQPAERVISKSPDFSPSFTGRENPN